MRISDNGSIFLLYTIDCSLKMQSIVIVIITIVRADFQPAVSKRLAVVSNKMPERGWSTA